MSKNRETKIPTKMTSYSPGIKATTAEGLRKVRRQWSEASPFKTVEDLIQAAPESQEELGKAGDEIAQQLGRPVRQLRTTGIADHEPASSHRHRGSSR